MILLSSIDSINSVMLIEEYTARLARQEVSRQLQALFLIKQEIYSILEKTKDPTMGLIRLKWWHDEVIKSRNNGFETLNKEFQLIDIYLNKVPEQNLKDIANWITAYALMISRIKIEDIVEDYIFPLARAYQKVLTEIFGVYISERVAFMVAANDFLDYVPYFLKNGCLVFENNEDFNNQITKIWVALEKLNLAEANSSYDKQIKFFVKAHLAVLEKYRKCKRWEINNLPKLNLGFMRMTLAVLAL